MTLRPCFIAYFDQNVMFPISISYIVLVQNKQKWTNQPLFCDIVTSKTIHNTDPWLQGGAWYILYNGDIIHLDGTLWKLRQTFHILLCMGHFEGNFVPAR